jgi:hypothetical protein
MQFKDFHIHELFLEWEIFLTEVVEKMKMYLMINNFFPKIVPVMSQCGQIL